MSALSATLSTSFGGIASNFACSILSGGKEANVVDRFLITFLVSKISQVPFQFSLRKLFAN